MRFSQTKLNNPTELFLSLCRCTLLIINSFVRERTIRTIFLTRWISSLREPKMKGNNAVSKEVRISQIKTARPVFVFYQTNDKSKRNHIEYFTRSSWLFK